MESKLILSLESLMVIYDICNAETIEKLVNTFKNLHNKTTWNKRLFGGKLIYWFNWYLSKESVVHYAINSMSYINTLQMKYNKMYEKHINRPKMYANAIRILSKCHLPISGLPQAKLNEILHEAW